jgi:hypothetical protein
MHINTYDGNVDIENCRNYASRGYTRISVFEENGGYILATQAQPYPAFIVEWTLLAVEPHRPKNHVWRELLVLPEKNALAWLDELVQCKAVKGIELTGILPLNDVKLEPYITPEWYEF